MCVPLGLAQRKQYRREEEDLISLDLFKPDFSEIHIYVCENTGHRRKMGESC